MALQAGDKLGPYEILGPIGAGGMGEVYKARDTRLGRVVAIKTSKEQFSERVSREARAVAALNHTNICHLYDVGPDYLVMEYVEGEDLRGPLDFPHTLPIVRQLIDGIEAAHEKNIVHRDLKPANIKITHDGVVKILDFGLARIDEQERAGDPENSPTLTMNATAAGTILGTAAYMSPEQARGKQADRRSDIWSFGAIFYELLTGKRLFAGDTPVEILGAVLNHEPDLTAAPQRARKLLAWCLEKDRKARLQAIGDARKMLDEAPEALPESPRGASRPLSWITVSGVLLFALAAVSFSHFREKPPEARVLNTSILPPDNATFDLSQGVGLFALSPDGRKIVFGARTADGKNPLWVRALDSATAQPLAGTENGAFPFWSLDSRFIAFFADGKLKKIDSGGGPAITLADASLGRGGSWNADGVIIFSPGNNVGPLLRVFASGGAATSVSSERGSLPWFLPDGSHFLYQDPVGSAPGQVQIRAGSLDGSKSKLIATGSTNAVYADGRILFLRESTLMAQPFDVQRLETAGEAIPVAEHVERVLNSGRVGAFSVSSSGLLVYRHGQGSRGAILTWFDRSGKPGAGLGDANPLQDRFQVSPDGKSVAAGFQEGPNWDIWIFDVSRGLRTRFTFDSSNNIDPVWSPDGRNIVFRSDRKGGRPDLYMKATDGTGAEVLLYADDQDKVPTSWSSDGKFLLYYNSTLTAQNKTGSDIWALPMNSGQGNSGGNTQGKPFPVVQGPFNEIHPRFSPDGKWIAYQSNESGRDEVYITPFPPSSGSGGKRQISGGGGMYPEWRQDGKEIFFVGPDNTLMAAEVSITGASVEVRQVRSLFSMPNFGLNAAYAVAANGQRFLHPVMPGQSSAIPLTLVENWTAALRK